MLGNSEPCCSSAASGHYLRLSYFNIDVGGAGGQAAGGLNHAPIEIEGATCAACSMTMQAGKPFQCSTGINTSYRLELMFFSTGRVIAAIIAVLGRQRRRVCLIVIHCCSRYESRTMRLDYFDTRQCPYSARHSARQITRSS